MPTVSIVLPTFNRARYIGTSIDSCLQQTFTDFELIVVIDGSTDETEQALKSYQDPRLIVIKKTENQGLPAALNTGFEIAEGKLFTWLGDDDLYMPQALEVMVSYLEKNQRCPMVCTDFYIIDEKGKIIGYGNEGWLSGLYRAAVANRIGSYRSEFMLVEDVDYFLRLQHFGGWIERIPRPYWKYRSHKATLSSLRLRERQTVSLRLHYELITEGIEEGRLEQLFRDRLKVSALLGDWKSMDSMIEFARAKRLEFADALARKGRLLKSRPVWLLLWSHNIVKILIRKVLGRIRNLYVRAVERRK